MISTYLFKNDKNKKVPHFRVIVLIYIKITPYICETE